MGIELRAIPKYDFPILLTCPDENHPHAIDLGLPSGTKWCCMNVGAHAPEDYGGYYAWGETSEKSVYNDITYQYISGEDTDGNGIFDKNRFIQNIGSDISGTSYDVAHVKMAGKWVMPSREKVIELIDNCHYNNGTCNGVIGFEVNGRNGGKIFLPAAGTRAFDKTITGSGDYWTSSKGSPESPLCAFEFCIESSTYYWDWLDRVRRWGLPVRAVCQ